MRADKDHAIALRKMGKSYRQISLKLGVSPGTLSGWFSGLHWSEKVKQKNVYLADSAARRHMISMNKSRAQILARRYADATREAEEEFERHKNDQLFIAALMLYVGEGDKSLANNMVRITNIEPRVLRLFHFFLKRYCPIEAPKVRAWVLLYPDLDQKYCEKYWQNALGMPSNHFYKSQIIQGKHKTKKLHYGVGTIILADKRLKTKVLRWMDLLGEKLEIDAGMV